MATLRLITLNCLGVPAPLTARRLRTLAHELETRPFDLVCLQEVQAHPYRRLLTAALGSYAARFEPFVYAPKGGLLTLARHPVVQAGFTLYSERGDWLGPSAADRLLHKGVLQSEVDLAGLRVFALNTHLSANYRGDWSGQNRYVQVERAQLAQLARLVRELPPDALVLVAGDFNVPRHSPLIQEFLAESGLRDPLAGDTRPTYRPLAGMPARYALPIDFALVRAPELPGLRIRSDLCFQQRRPLLGGGEAFLSDHCGIELELSWEV
jgi:endonuclease/exonuclease/phosphatase family metal-dependent hydrolase